MGLDGLVYGGILISNTIWNKQWRSAYRDELFGRLLGSMSVYHRSPTLWYKMQSDKHKQKK